MKLVWSILLPILTYVGAQFFAPGGSYYGALCIAACCLGAVLLFDCRKWSTRRGWVRLSASAGYGLLLLLLGSLVNLDGDYHASLLLIFCCIIGELHCLLGPHEDFED